MSTRWEQLAGDTSRFAVKMAFVDDVSGTEVEPELRASWGSFEIWINGANVCAHVEEGEIVDAVHWYLLPLLDWLATNWNALLHEERLPVRNAGRDAVESLYATRFSPPGLTDAMARERDDEWYLWRQRHALHAARDGGLFPELFLRRLEDEIEASWSNQSPAGSPDGFGFLVPHGRATFDPDEVAEPLFAVLRAATNQLQVWQPASTRVEELQATLRELTKPSKQREARLDWLFSLRPASVEGSNWGTVRSWFRGTSAQIRKAVLDPSGSSLVLRGSSHAVLLFGSVAPTINENDARRLASYLIDLFDESGDPAPLSELVDQELGDDIDGLPWERGYELADEVLDLLAQKDVRTSPIRETLSDLGVRVSDIVLDDERIRAVAVAGPQHHPAVLVNRSHPRNDASEGEAFTLAHELCHLIADRRMGRKLAIASGPWAPIEVEQRANAFAAYFLMPPSEVRRTVAHLTVQLPTLGGIREVAAAFGTSYSATLEHLHNLGWLDDFERDRLRATSLGDEAFGRLATGRNE